MKQSGTTIVFVLVCIGVLVAAYVVGLGIREIRFSAARAESVSVAKPEKITVELDGEDARTQAKQMPDVGEMDGADAPSPGGRAGFLEQRDGMKERFENMTDEEREQFRAQMRDRFGGRQRDMGPQLSEEDRTKMREEIDALRARWEEMSEQEREEARNQISEKYGVTPRGLGGGRGFGDGEGGRRRSGIRPDAGQLENN
jgi:uncharacterized membrane protein